MNLLQTVKTWLGGRTLDGYPTAAVSRDAWQFWQRGFDRDQQRSGAVAAAEGGIDAYVQSIAQLPAAHYRRNDNGGKEVVTTSALSRILRNPNKYQTASDFKSFMVRQLLTTGNAYAVATRNARYEVDSLHPVYSMQIEPLIDRETKEYFYHLRANPLAPFDDDGNYVAPARDVLHIKLYTPSHPLKGVSPLTYATMAMASNSALSAHMATFFANMSRPSMILSTDAVLNGDQMQRLRAAWEEQSTRMSSGHTPILSNGIKAQQLSLSSQDAQLVDAFRLTVEDIARALRIPLPMMGIATTYSSTEQLISFWLSSGLGYMVNHIEVAIDKFFDLPADEFVEFDTDTLLRTDFSARIDGLTKGILGGLFSPNEARAKMELPAVEFGDEPRVQAQVVPLSMVEMTQAAPSAPAAADPAPEPKPTEEPAATPAEDKGVDHIEVHTKLASRLRANQ